jgi:hypothetical protein
MNARMKLKNSSKALLTSPVSALNVQNFGNPNALSPLNRSRYGFTIFFLFPFYFLS